MKKGYIILIILFITALVIIGLFIAYLSFSTTSDLSKDLRFKDYLNKPIIVKQSSVLKQNPESTNRFSSYFLDSYM